MTIHRFTSTTIVISSMSVMITLTKVGTSIVMDVTDKFITAKSNVSKLSQRQKDQLRQALLRIQLSNARAVTFLQETGL